MEARKRAEHVGWRRVGEEAVLVGLDHVVKIEVAAAQASGLAGGKRLLGLTPTMARPTGIMKPFCEPETQTSTPHSSMRKSMRGERADGIDEEQGRMSGIIQARGGWPPHHW